MVGRNAERRQLQRTSTQHHGTQSPRWPAIRASVHSVNRSSHYSSWEHKAQDRPMYCILPSDTICGTICSPSCACQLYWTVNRLCLFCDHRNCVSTPQVNHNFPDLQVGGQPETYSTVMKTRTAINYCTFLWYHFASSNAGSKTKDPLLLFFITCW